MRLLYSVGFCLLAALAADAASTIDKALPCGKVGTVGGLGAGTDMQRVVVRRAGAASTRTTAWTR
jgi:hypothetical protein